MIAELRAARAVQWAAGMRTYNLEIDFQAGTTVAIARDGRRYTMLEIQAAERHARRGDEAAKALLASVDIGVDEDGRRLSPEELRDVFRQTVHDCPECRAAHALGAPVDLEPSAAFPGADGGPPIAWTALELYARENDQTHRRDRQRRRRHR
ncbi:MAG TPA: hypothetical protein VHE35_08625 [Kofleriaceae bacterium]|nr:hypothetical protein [Kofleriaceae bacterium]